MYNTNMTEKTSSQDETKVFKITFGIIATFIFFALVIFASYKMSLAYPSNIILPGGTTYLGPNAPK
jgi:hypothetical protein